MAAVAWKAGLAAKSSLLETPPFVLPACTALISDKSGSNRSSLSVTEKFSMHCSALHALNPMSRMVRNATNKVERA